MDSACDGEFAKGYVSVALALLSATRLPAELPSGKAASPFATLFPYAVVHPGVKNYVRHGEPGAANTSHVLSLDPTG